MIRPSSASLPLRVAAVLAGGVLGGFVRYLATVVTVASDSRRNFTHLWTAVDLRLLAVNSIGVFFASWALLGPLSSRTPDDPWRLFWTTGVLGGLTTYSSLILDVGVLWRTQPAGAVLEMAVSLFVGLGAALVGCAVARAGSRP